MYEFLPSTRFLCEKVGKSGTAENEREKKQKSGNFPQKAEEVATLTTTITKHTEDENKHKHKDKRRNIKEYDEVERKTG